MNHFIFVFMEVKIGNTWKAEMSDEFSKPYFKELVEKVKSAYRDHPDSTFPRGNQIFRAFDSCPFNEVKVVILGQDPYPTKGHAHGLCFSVESSVRPLPKSLQNIYKEIERDLLITCPSDGNLMRWADQGVLLLNAVLTVREGNPGSHAGIGWEKFTDAVITRLNSRKENLVYLLWGSHAIKKAQAVNKDKNLVLEAPHPSPLSAYRGFFGCAHFSKTNQYLKSKGIDSINW